MGRLSVQDFIFEFMRQDGAPAVIDMNVAYGAGLDYLWTAPATHNVALSRVIFEFRGANIAPTDFGDGAALTNGITVKIFDNIGIGAEQYDFLDGEVIKQNGDFAWLAGSDVGIISGGGVSTGLPIRWSIFKAGGEMILPANWELRVSGSEDLSGYGRWRTVVQGYLIT